MSRSESVSSNEKGQSERVETSHVNIDPVQERRTIRKVDWRLLPILAALYSISLIDRGNLALARIAGMDRDLQLFIGERYSIVSLIFFPLYIILELPSNILMRRFGAANWLSFIGVAWGTIQLAMGLIHKWWELAILRLFLGVLEAGFFPACVFLISTWYTRREVQKRLSFFYALSIVASGFSAILAAGLAEIGGKVRLQGRVMLGWRWIFIVEGLITIVLGFAAYFLVVDFPDKNTFLSVEQTALVKARIEKDRGDAEYDAITLKKCLKYVADLKLWGFGLMFCSATLPSYAFSFFLPIILLSMGYTPRQAQLLSAPPFIFACLLMLLLAFTADKYNTRAPIIALQSIICIIGLLLVAFHHDNKVRYFGTFFGLGGAQANVPAILAYQSINIVGQSKRSFASALSIGFGGIGGICASVAFRQVDSPKYIPGLWTTIAFQLMNLLILGTITAYFVYKNKQAKKGLSEIEGRAGFYYTI